MTKAQLLRKLETIPQNFWPPRPTRQDKAELERCIRAAENVTKSQIKTNNINGAKELSH